MLLPTERKNASIAYLLQVQIDLREQSGHLTNFSGGILLWAIGKAVLGWKCSGFDAL
jgi:hypothetical protein